MKAIALFLAVFGVCLFAEASVPEGDPLASLIALISNFKAMSPIAIGIGVVTIAVQALKAFVGESFKYKRLSVTVLGVVYGVLVSVSNGMGILEALVLGLLTSGGAVAIYEAIKGLSLVARDKRII